MGDQAAARQGLVRDLAAAVGQVSRPNQYVALLWQEALKRNPLLLRAAYQTVELAQVLFVLVTLMVVVLVFTAVEPVFKAVVAARVVDQLPGSSLDIL